ncbi:NAD(P)-dependent oxidoreductase [uncultured Microscilla sp.]|uniref:NAD-dependent epimerase/dehydratase family protein n=1 Tax=uncultured Microscilla sp. TaxID=432653 RepID=UPI0026070EA7|nr:NAD(P)-dependent oxidoreductase [uncultured Microscilla sp.]
MKKHLITGAGGLIGAELIKHLLLDQENQVFAISRQQPTTDQDRLTYITLDFSTEWNTSVLPENIDTIIHLAQSPDFRDFPQKSESVFNVNTISTLKLLNYAQQTGVKKFVLASSGGIYGNGNNGFTENTPIITNKNLGFYLGTKLCSEIIADSYAQFFDLVMLRFFFVYGAHQRKDMLIPRLVGFVKNKQPITLQGHDGLKINPIYVSDAVEAIIKSFDLKGNHKINIGGQEILSLREIGHIIGEVTGVSPEFKTDLESSAKNVIGDITKMSDILTPPKISFKDGIKLLTSQS